MKWKFAAYASEEDYNKDNHFFTKVFNSHEELKMFSAEHSAKEKPNYPDYCSMYSSNI